MKYLTFYKWNYHNVYFSYDEGNEYIIKREDKEELINKNTKYIICGTGVNSDFFTSYNQHLIETGFKNNWKRLSIDKQGLKEINKILIEYEKLI